MSYPPEIEAWWLQAAIEATACPEPTDALASLEVTATRLSDRFTVERPAVFSDYTRNARDLAAYGIFFFPQTFTRIGHVLRECLPSHPEPHTWRILDLGSGTGASSLASAMALRDQKVFLTSVDHSPHALTHQRNLFDACHALWPQASLETQIRNARADGIAGFFDLILASFVVNELFPESDDAMIAHWARSQVDRLTPHGRLALIEPAGSTACERLQRLRNRFASDTSICVLAPCPHSHSCPMLGADHGYCHDVRSWRVPDTLNILNRNMLRSVHNIKYGTLVLGHKDSIRPPWAEDSCVFRLVAPISRTKGRLVMRGCFGDGRFREIELQTRGLTRTQIDAICEWERGDILRMVDGRPLGDGRIWRVAGLEPICVAPAATMRNVDVQEQC